MKAVLTTILSGLLTLLMCSVTASAETITGTVTNTSAVPLNQILVEARQSASSSVFVANTRTNAAGGFTLTLPPGSYFVRTYNGAHYINQAYASGGNLPCVGECNLNVGTPIVVPPAGIATNISFALVLGATISGTVTSETTGLPIANLRIEVVDGATFIEDVTTDATGAYVTENGFPTGSYQVRTDDNSQGYINEFYPNIPCLVRFNCPTVSGGSVAVSNGAIRANTNIALRPGGRFSGRVADATTGAGLTGQIQVFNTGGQEVARQSIGANGTFVTGRGLPTGSYVVRTFEVVGHVNEFHDGTVCVGGCSVATIDPIATVEGTTTPVPPIELNEGGHIRGTARDASTGNPLANLEIQVLSATGSQVTISSTSSAGVYTSRDALPSGTYYVRTTNFNFINVTALTGYVHELYPDVSCGIGCTVALGTPVVVNAGATTDGINFSLARGGAVSGRVFSNANPGTGIPLATVTILTATGTTVSSGPTDASGRYATTAGIPPGQYFARVANTRGFVNELYPDISCMGSLCPALGGSPVGVNAGGVATLDFGLATGARLSGSVLDEMTLALVPGGNVQVLNGAGQTLMTQSLDGLGNYLTGPGLLSDAGPFYARTTNGAGYQNELYPAVPCNFGCRLTDGVAIPLGAPGTTKAGINFTLQQGGRITGTVTDESTGAPLANVSVQAFSLVANTSLNGTTDGGGQFALIGLADGTYYVRTTNAPGYINESFDDVPCVFTCTNTTLGVPQIISGANTIAGVDIDLPRGGRVSGVVTDAANGLPLAGVGVTVVDASGITVSTATTGLSGTYTTVVGIAAGNYAVFTAALTGHLNELYDDVKCNGPCAARSGRSLAIVAGATLAGIDFALDAGGRVAGRVTEVASGAGIQNITVQIFDATGRQVTSANTDADGQYISAGLTTGSYFARTSNGLGYVDELYDNRPCPASCPVVGSDAFVVTSPATTANINFGLAAGGRVSGLVSDTGTGQPVGGVTVQVFDGTGRLMTTAGSSAFGVYTTGSGLPSGRYYARTTNQLGYINQLYGGAPCTVGCVVTSSAPIDVIGAGTTSNVDFALGAGATVTGTIIDLFGTPLRNIGVAVLNASGAQLTTGTTNALGQYVTTQGLETGSYYVRTTNSLGYINQLLKVPAALPCLGTCDVTAGTPVAVVAGAAAVGVDFELEAGGRLRGVVTRADGTPQPSVTVTVVGPDGRAYTNGVSDGNGAYVTGAGLPTGNYFAVTENGLGLVNEVFDNLPCLSSCVATAGTPIPLSAGLTTPGVDFRLDTDTDVDGDGISGTVDANPGSPSNAFTDVPLGGSTSGTVSRAANFTELVGDLSPGGVQVQVVGAGPGVVRFDVCAGGANPGAETATLDRNGEIATLACNPATGSTTLRAISASPFVELRDPKLGFGAMAIASVPTGQAVTMGSPATAGAGNTQSVDVAFFDAAGKKLGSLSLDAGEVAETRVINPAGGLETTVLAGAVTLSVGGQVTTLTTGQSQTFLAPEDVNLDGVVNCTDVSIVRAAYGKRTGQAGFQPLADVNKDGVINILDLSRISKALPRGTRCA